MALLRFSVTQVRNLKALQLEFSQDVNLIIGANGSGKTSILEAIFLLGRGRSFRNSQLAGLIAKGASELVVFAEIQENQNKSPVPIGISKSLDGDSLIRVSGETVQSAAQLASLLPVQLINPDAFELLNGGPRNRRQFIDWGVFHVEHSFYELWTKLNKCLKQRNKLLRHGKIDRLALSAWDKEFAAYAEKISAMRRNYVDRLRPVFFEVLADLVELNGLSLSFYAGWDSDKSLADVLTGNFERDAASGFTRVGPQRADLGVRYLGQSARDVLSRGQQKLVVSALKIAQGRLLGLITGRRCLYLVDDLAAELDKDHCEKLCELLNGLDCQLFITSVERDLFTRAWGSRQVKMFHVEHGQVV